MIFYTSNTKHHPIEARSSIKISASSWLSPLVLYLPGCRVNKSQGITQIPLPPSTSKFTPVMNFPSSEDMKSRVLATSVGSVKRPRGTLLMNFARFSGVSGTPANDSKLKYHDQPLLQIKRSEHLKSFRTYSPVPLNNGQTAFTRI